ncbi:hypothetical protein Nepgr_031718 [Nepenthes gracilis]|uniref:TF-B3 domain-containing protein n=1 Tax=Nepenthes gracilis TaxID=150966 RepID=A0AAD3THW3_NEPGR|nr:hypothetical protein Nepgr_031718 [Nepenthes gracilis]
MEELASQRDCNRGPRPWPPLNLGTAPGKNEHKGLIPGNNPRWEGCLIYENQQRQQQRKSETGPWQLFNTVKSTSNLVPQEVGPSTSNWTDYYHHQQQNSKIVHMKASEEAANRDDEAGVSELAAAEGSGGGDVVERVHMFDKVVTPSDVGKLNRLVIPKQHAEKYFPLDSSTNEKGLLLNFEDRSGKSWRFRYSYWNSSQSYVMTKGWSRFVREKKLDAGDVVSFQRGVGEQGKDRFYIDWRRRPDDPLPQPRPQAETPLFPHHNLNFNMSLHQRSIPAWSTPLLLRTHPQLPHLPMAVRDHAHSTHLPQMNIISMIPQYPNSNPNYHRHHQSIITGYGRNSDSHGYANHHHHAIKTPGSSSSVIYLKPASQQQGQQLHVDRRIDGAEPMVFESVPVVQGKVAAKRLRLFGVNMDCPIPQADDCDILSCNTASTNANINLASKPPPLRHHHGRHPYSKLSSSSSSPLNHPNPPFQFSLYNCNPLPAMPPDYLGDKGKSPSSSLSLDLGI